MVKGVQAELDAGGGGGLGKECLSMSCRSEALCSGSPLAGPFTVDTQAAVRMVLGGGSRGLDR